MRVFFGSSLVCVLIMVTGAIGLCSSFDQEHFKPYQWGWKANTKDFDNVPRTPCPPGDLQKCDCKSDLRKSIYLVVCPIVLTQNESYRLQVPYNTTHFRLFGNSFHILLNGSFQNATHLAYLDLSDNDIRDIENNAFAGLHNLMVLDLSFNALYAPAVFLQPLSSLRVLNIKGQVPHYIENGTYSNIPLSYIVEGLSELQQLEKLAFSSEYFSMEDTVHLEKTSATYIAISNFGWISSSLHLEYAAFSTWKNLKVLEITSFGESLGDLSMDLIYNISGLYAECLHIQGSLSGEITFYRFQAPNLKALSIQNTAVESVDFQGLRTLHWLDFSYNRIESFTIIADLPYLHHFDISGQQPRYCLSFDYNIWPESLTFVDFSGTPLCDVPLPCTDDHYALKVAIFGGVPGPCHGNKISIQSLGLQDIGFQCVSSTFFSQYDWSSLNILKLSNNELGSGGSDRCRNTNPMHIMDFLKPLWNLTDLYLGGNYIVNDLPSNMILNQTRLKSLHLMQMALSNFTLEIGHLTDLKFIDISHNKIQCLHTSTIRDINTVIHYTPVRRNVSEVFELNLSQNPLQCSCSCLEFYVWMRNVRNYVTFPDLASHKCTFDSGEGANLSNLNLIVDILRSQCARPDRSSVVRTSTAIVLTYMFILAATTTFRFRHTLRYIWLKHRMHREYLERHILDPKYRFDAFVSCDRTDAIWVKRNFLPKLENQQTGLKFCVAQRDFIVGATIIDNIIRSITQSRKVVCIISQNFLKSGWCKEELLLSHHESLSRGKNLLICIFMPDIIHNQLNDRFRFILNHMTCIKWPRDPAAQQVFWIMLQRALLDGQPNINEV